MDTNKRIQEIDAELAELELEKAELERQLLEAKADKWSEEGLKERLRKAILSRFGSLHNIKMVKLMMNSNYDDNHYSYENAVLLVVDKDFNDVLDHGIDASDFCPTEEEQSERWRAGNRRAICENVTIKF